MLLAIDVGNTQTVIGLYDGERLAEHWRIATERHRTGDELGALLARFVELEELDGVVVSTTVPQLVREYSWFVERYVQAPLLVVGPGTRTGIAIRYDDPREVGPDRIANALAAREKDGAPCIVVDFGTSTWSHREASTSVACSRPASRSRWMRCSRGRHGCSRSTSWHRRA